MKARKTRETARGGLDVVRISAFTSAALVVLGITTLFGQTRVGFGLTHANQDPAPPSSPPYVSLVPDNLDFGDQVVRRTSAAKSITA